MAPTRMLAAAVSSLLMLIAPASASEYRAGELFGLDLSKAVLSPKRMGPPAEFVSVPVQARTDARPVVGEPEASNRADRKPSVAQKLNIQKKRAPAPARLAHRRSPLDAHAMDTRIQRWPCKSGGICNWKR